MLQSTFGINLAFGNVNFNKSRDVNLKTYHIETTEPKFKRTQEKSR